MRSGAPVRLIQPGLRVHNGALTATFVYATPGAEGLRQELKFLGGEEVPKTVVLDTLQVTSENADEILQQHRAMGTADGSHLPAASASTEE
jgi:hypothetical protein